MKIFMFLLTISFTALGQQTKQDTNTTLKYLDEAAFSPQSDRTGDYIEPDGSTIETRFRAPEDFQRVVLDKYSFGNYLRNLPLKPHGAQVLLYNGEVKRNLKIYEAVVSLKIGDKNLHQCADAIIRLRAEYLWKQGKYDQIHFNFTNGFRVDYSEWMKGKRIQLAGNKTSWIQTKAASNTYADFWEYMEIVFQFAGTLSLSRELIPVSSENIQIGDVLIKGGTPGHAVIVVDMVFNPKTNEKLFLLAQSYMPAQEIQVLKNRMDLLSNPWFYFTDLEVLDTPEWTFYKEELKRFQE